jgi:hypothetical protein
MEGVKRLMLMESVDEKVIVLAFAFLCPIRNS